VRLLLLLGGLLTVGSIGQATGGSSYPYYYENQWYYQPYSGGYYYYTHYYYAPNQYHHAYYYPNYGRRYVYYYNYHTKKHWGRFDNETGKYAMLPDNKKSGDLAQLLKDNAFPDPTLLKD